MSNHLFDNIFSATIKCHQRFLLNAQQVITYSDFHNRVNQLANALLASGLKTGDRVAVQAEKSSTLLALYVATIKSGGVYLPLNTSYTLHEITYFITNSESSIVIIDESLSEAVSPLAYQQKAHLHTLNKDEGGSLTELADQQSTQFSAIDRGHEDLAAILYTSGTTGRPKGAMLSHHNLLSNTEVLREIWQFTEKDVLLHMLPIYHTHGLFVACNLIALVGGSLIFLPKFDSKQALAWMPEATCMMGVPTFYTRLLSEAGFDRQLTAHMRLFISGSAPLLAQTHKAFEARTGMKILERYGMSETNMCTSNPYEGARIAGTVGLPLPGIELRITTEDGQAVADGDIGMIELRGDNVFTGYWKMPEKTAESFRKDGFFITGDLAKKDKNGYIVIVGRDKDLIISGGLNIYPKEVEDLIDQIKGIEESAVIGIPHEDFGEAVLAVIVRKDQTVSAENIFEHISNKLAKFKQPKAIIFVDALPRNMMGKVQKAELRKQHQSRFA